MPPPRQEHILLTNFHSCRIILWSRTRMRRDSKTFNTSTELLVDLFFAAVFTSLRFEFVHGRSSRETVGETWSNNIFNMFALFAPFWFVHHSH